MNLVFDFGGVLLRWQPADFMPRLLPAYATSPATTLQLITEFFQGFDGDWGLFDGGRIDVAQLALRIAQRTRMPLAEVERTIAAIAGELQPVPGTVAIIDALQARGHRLWFLSNMPASYATAIDAAHPIGTWFEGGLYSSRVGLRKPDAAVFRLLAERFGLDPTATLFVDDAARNIDAASALGWQTLHFHDPAQCAAELLRRGLL